MVIAPLTVATFGDQFFLVGLVTKLPRLLPGFVNGTGNFYVQAIPMPKLPILTFCVDHIEDGHLD